MPNDYNRDSIDELIPESEMDLDNLKKENLILTKKVLLTFKDLCKELDRKKVVSNHQQGLKMGD